ncbi:MAG: 1-deoxy-D-xylulose-5-phosphate reductoisomerase [Bacteroidales bacterium]|jgi:1-deoxy-D-xylulose-5-phosphate reductoisomerase|nr:1-deoxy-D-xylulose-5-phosphate reductoisomerase [Bacteroidales bacterium]
MKKRIAILGSTGSIGTQTLEVIRQFPDRFSVEVLTAGSQADLLIQQALEFKPNTVVIRDKEYYEEVKNALLPHYIKVFAGEESLSQIVQMDSIDVVLLALVGFLGLKPALSAIEAGKHIALANKETLVVAGELVTKLAVKKRVAILPVDSEHSAIFQCLQGENLNSVEKIFLTASGGPFRGFNKKQLSKVTSKEALNHPNWKMGHKITIDSATLMNKGLEVIEAKWLFGLEPSQIEVIVHPQSVIHSMVQFTDGSIKAQMGMPDMRIPIQYALSYPERFFSNFPRFSFAECTMLNFEQVDQENFPNLTIAYKALSAGGNMPCILNAANEIAVDAFLNNKTGFLKMSDVIEQCMELIPFISNPTFEDYLSTDHEARIKALELIN